MYSELSDGTRLWYDYVGNGEEVIVQLGGALLYRHNFAFVNDELSRHFRLLVHDPRGYGYSDRPMQKLSIDVWADDLAELMENVGQGSAHIFGTGLGAMIALRLASRHPRLTRSLIWSGGFLKSDLYRQMRYRTWQRFARIVGMGDILADFITLEAIGAKRLEEGPEIVDWFREMTQMVPLETFALACTELETFDVTADVAMVSVPTLVLAAREDTLTPFEGMGGSGLGSKAVYEGIKGSELVLFDGIGHSDVMEAPSKSAEAVTKFIQGLASGEREGEQVGGG